MDERLWLEAAARVTADLDLDIRLEAAEVFSAEAARCRLDDREGHAAAWLLGGHTIDGDLRSDDPVAGHLWMLGLRRSLVRASAIVSLTGTRARLRTEEATPERSLGSVLREWWHGAEALRVLTCDGGVTSGVLGFVGADHAEVRTAEGPVVLPFAAVVAWLL